MCGALLICQQWFPCPWTNPLAFRSPIHQMWGYSQHGCGEVWFSFCCLQGDHVCPHSFVQCLLIRLGAEYSWSIIVRCCSLSVSSISPALGVNWWMVVFKLANWSLNCLNSSKNSAKGQWISVSSQYSSDNSLSPSGIVCSSGARCRGAESWVAGASSISWLPYLVVMVCVLWHISKVLGRAFMGDCLQSQDMCVLKWWCWL